MIQERTFSIREYLLRCRAREHQPTIVQQDFYPSLEQLRQMMFGGDLKIAVHHEREIEGCITAHKWRESRWYAQLGSSRWEVEIFLNSLRVESSISRSRTK